MTQHTPTRRKLSAAAAARLLDSLLAALLAAAGLEQKEGAHAAGGSLHASSIRDLVELLQHGCTNSGCQPAAIATASGGLAGLLLEQRQGGGDSGGAGTDDTGREGVSGSGGKDVQVPAADRLASWLHLLLFSQVQPALADRPLLL